MKRRCENGAFFFCAVGSSHKDLAFRTWGGVASGVRFLLPLPASASAGLAMLAGLGLLAAWRKKMGRVERVEGVSAR